MEQERDANVATPLTVALHPTGDDNAWRASLTKDQCGFQFCRTREPECYAATLKTCGRCPTGLGERLCVAQQTAFMLSAMCVSHCVLTLFLSHCTENTSTQQLSITDPHWVQVDKSQYDCLSKKEEVLFWSRCRQLCLPCNSMSTTRWQSESYGPLGHGDDWETST